MKNIKIKDIMTVDPEVIAPTTSLKEAAWKMQNSDCGFLPVCLRNEVIGVITDRDIVIRATSQGANPERAKVYDFMTHDVYCCNENDFVEDAIDKMHEHRISRIVVKNKTGEITGVVSFGGILRKQAETSDIAHIVKRSTHLSVY